MVDEKQAVRGVERPLRSLLDSSIEFDEVQP